MITIIDYGYGNIFSIVSAFKALGYECQVTDSKKDILNSNILVLPGVGSFKQAIMALERKKLKDTIINVVKKGKNIIGICLGYQMLFERSNEFGINQGLGLIKGEVLGLSKENIIEDKVPNVGWRALLVNDKNGVLSKYYHRKMVYFVHSFVPVAKDNNQVSSFIEFNNNKIHASIHYENIVGYQFHPEKSGQIGLSLLNSTINYFNETN